MRKAQVYMNNILAGTLEELGNNQYQFSYDKNYQGASISLTLAKQTLAYQFDKFPPFFEGLLPEGKQLEALLHHCKLDRNDYFGQLVQVGHDLVGAVTVELMP